MWQLLVFLLLLLTQKGLLLMPHVLNNTWRQQWWHMPIIPVFRKLRQEDRPEFNTRLNCIARPNLNQSISQSINDIWVGIHGMVWLWTSACVVKSQAIMCNGRRRWRKIIVLKFCIAKKKFCVAHLSCSMEKTPIYLVKWFNCSVGFSSLESLCHIWTFTVFQRMSIKNLGTAILFKCIKSGSNFRSRQRKASCRTNLSLSVLHMHTHVLTHTHYLCL